MTQDTKSRAEDIFRKVFRMPDLEISREMQAKDVEGWDSLAHLTLIMAIEDSFKIKFSTKEVLSFRNVGDMLDVLTEKLQG